MNRKCFTLTSRLLSPTPVLPRQILSSFSVQSGLWVKGYFTAGVGVGWWVEHHILANSYGAEYSSIAQVGQ